MTRRVHITQVTETNRNVFMQVLYATEFRFTHALLFLHPIRDELQIIQTLMPISSISLYIFVSTLKLSDKKTVALVLLAHSSRVDDRISLTQTHTDITTTDICTGAQRASATRLFVCMRVYRADSARMRH